MVTKPSARRSAVQAPPVAADTSAASSSKPRRGGIDVERGVTAGAEHLREVLGTQPARHDVGVGHGERPAVAVAGGPGVGAGGVGAHPEAGAVEVQDRTTTGGNGVDVEHRGAHPDAGDLGLDDTLVVAGEVRHVGRGAAHVEADQRSNPAASAVRAMPTTPPAGPDNNASLPLKRCASVRPPLDCMNVRRQSAGSSAAIRST